MLYLLHWLILDAAAECEVPSEDAVYPVSSLQLFVYLFTPLLHKLKAEDLNTLKLKQGLKIWQALWDHSQPMVQSVYAAVKPDSITRPDAGKSLSSKQPLSCKP